MNPSPQAIAAIQARVADWSPANDAVAASLNAQAVANPAAQATVATPFTTAQVFALLSPASAAKASTVAFVPDVRDKIAANDRAGCGLYAALLLAGGVITRVEHDAFLGLLAATQLDPSYQPQISWALATLGRPVDAADVAAARPH